MDGPLRMDDKPTITRLSSKTPARRPNSVRRTTNIDIVAPTVREGRVSLSGSGRDLLTDAEGNGSVVATAGMEAQMEFGGRRRIVSLETTPTDIDVAALVGASTATGLRRALRPAMPEHTKGSLLAALLDDIPVTTMLAVTPYHRAGEQALLVDAPVIGVCAGWAPGGQLEQRVLQGLALAVVGPVPPPVTVRVDPMSWHEVGPIQPKMVRRRRRLDLIVPRAAGGPFELDVLHRDTVGEMDGTETVVHEYRLRGSVSAADRTVLTLVAQPHILPGAECPLAADFVHRLIGLPLAGVRDAVGKLLTGVECCTHLNGALKATSDLATLIPLLTNERG